MNNMKSVEVYDVETIKRVQNDYELMVCHELLENCIITVGEYWDSYGGGDGGYDWNCKAQELNLSCNYKLDYLFDISNCSVLDIKKYDEEDYEEGYIDKEDIGRIAIKGFNGWFGWYDEDYLLRDAILDYILEMEDCVKDYPNWIEYCQEWDEDEE